MFETPYTNPILALIPLIIVLGLGIWMTVSRFKERKKRIKHILTVIEGGKKYGR